MQEGYCESQVLRGYKMIFVTVGTSDFDALVSKMDDLAPALDEKVVIQIGHGNYTPSNCEYFGFAPSLDEYYDQADVVVAHGGLGTTMEVLTRGIKLISVENTTCVDDHQTDILSALSQEGYLIWCRGLDELEAVLARISDTELRPYLSPPCTIGQVIQEYLEKLE
jgi:UDP-N-acetylglucosamine transferase subunit ALG13